MSARQSARRAQKSSTDTEVGRRAIARNGKGGAGDQSARAESEEGDKVGRGNEEPR